MICAVIPAYKASRTVCDVIAAVLPHVDRVIVVDDACPERSGHIVERSFAGRAVEVIMRDRNGGVGAATKTGIGRALALHADVIVKIDADDQMDAEYIPAIGQLFRDDPNLALVKGNRFFDPLVMRRMPATRLFGNSCLSLLVKFASGYWNILDPTNGYLAFNGRLLRAIDWQGLADRYFFEISALCEFGLRHGKIAEMHMDTIYSGAGSSLSIVRTLLSFPPKLLRLFLRRLILQYFVYDINLGSLYIFFGFFLSGLSAALLGFEWLQSHVTGIPRTTGTVMLGVLPFLMGFQLLLNALLYDVQFGPKSVRELLVMKPDRTLGRSVARIGGGGGSLTL